MDELEIDRKLLIETFVAEAHEILENMEQLLVGLEARPDDDETLHSIFRCAHTLKGSASLVAFDEVRDLAHDLEDLLQRLRAKTLSVDKDVITLLLQSVDVLRLVLDRTIQGDTAPTREAADLKARIAGVKGEAVRSKEPEPSPQPLPSVRAKQGPEPSPQPSPNEPRAEQGPEAAGEVKPEELVAGRSSGQTLRVDIAKLDQMLNLAGEIAIARGRLTDMLDRKTALSIEEILLTHHESDWLHLQLQELIMKARMVPIGPIFYQHRRTIRDMAAANGKRVQLVIEGADSEVDNAIVEQIRNPLTHMVRNALDHGIELPEIRRSKGKDPSGLLTLRAYHDTGNIVIEVEDDGAGLSRSRIVDRAVKLGLLSDASGMTEEQVHQLIFAPGLSTSESVTEISGRGVGMDVVRRNVEALHGSVGVTSMEGTGTIVTLRFPLTLAIVQGLVVGAGNETYIIPLDSVVECLELPPDEGTARSGTGIINMRGNPLPFMRLRELFHISGPPPPFENVVVVRKAGTQAGIAVDVLQGESQTIIKPLAKVFRGLPGISGSSILGDGRVALILDVAGLLRETRRRTGVALA
jgi:two-component system chemotaxis sensor kinase CheA